MRPDAAIEARRLYAAERAARNPKLVERARRTVLAALAAGTLDAAQFLAEARQCARAGDA